MPSDAAPRRLSPTLVFMKPALPTPTPSAIAGAFVDAFDGRYYRISHVDHLPPFLMNVVSASDLWLFLASNGGLTAGRGHAGRALFPYQTVDRIYDSAGVIGPFTALQVRHDGRDHLWEPLAAHPPHAPAVSRHLYKSVEGDRVWFEERHDELGLVFRYGWATAGDHGFVRRCSLENISGRAVSVRLVDGLRHLLPPGIPARLQNESSCLTDAYKTAELLPHSSLAVYSLAAAIVDRAIPMESLRASIVWSAGLPDAVVLLSDEAASAFLDGERTGGETHRRGIRGTYALAANLELAPGASPSWMMVADTDLSQSEVVHRRRQLAAGGMRERVEREIAASTRRLRTLVAAADGLQAGGEETTTAHHFANVLFNLMRGGIFVAGHTLPGRDFAAFVALRNRPAADRHAAFLAALPDSLDRDTFLARLATRDDPDLERIGLEYLPLTFSRRHGDPSRPWNRFEIRVRDEHGARVLHHEGNWRDIFQNWEALCLGHPAFLESIVAKFVNASTIDGYNPYRLSHAGLDWEVPDPEDPWSSIGYWGDHQTIYLLKLLEWSGRFHPGALAAWLRRPLFSFADVPYRIACYDAMRRDPHVTIEFDQARHRAAVAAIADYGTDARLLRDPAGRVHHVTLTEKLLLLALTRLTNFVPGGGIWMNTQRPEWNDANNALVGYGVSMVTLCYLRRFLAHLQREVLPALGDEPVALSAPLVTLATDVLDALDGHTGLLASPTIPDDARRALLDALAGAGSRYRAAVYAQPIHAPASLATATVARLLARALAFVDHTIRANLRPDGLCHAYNLLEFTEQPAGLKLHRLSAMLEGQVAVLSAGALTAAEAAALLHALRQSPLYRADQHSYLLYPDRQLPGFLDRNVLPEDAVPSCALLRDLLAAGDARLVVRDDAGAVRFHPDLVNGEALAARLDLLAADPAWRDAVAAQRPAVAAIYERVFHHRAFTGRSGSMFGYEGLGCIYWHMVAKLLLAVQENLFAAEAAGDPAAPALAASYHDIRAGLGFNKSPARYGAFPTDPYSHTPGHAGAQQPGMTGQVKEEILTRFGELGVRVEQGCVRFAPTLLTSAEFTPAETIFSILDLDGHPRDNPLPAGSLGFTFCGVPVVYRKTTDAARLRLRFADGTTREIAGDTLDADVSRLLCSRSGRIVTVEVELGSAFLSAAATA